MIDDINLWYAKDKNNNIVKIVDINENNRKEEYFCPICMSGVIPKLGTKTKHHFAHIDASKCTNESFIHFWIKNKLLSVGDSFKIKTNDDILSYKCISIEMEKEYKTQHGTYKPDITVTTDTNEIIFFEIAYTNKKRIDEYYQRWSDLNNTVVEINAKHLINGSEDKEFKCVYHNGDICNFVFKEYKNTTSFKLYKDNLFKENDIKEAEERLKKIDWFWQECYKRRFNKISDEDFFDIIDYLDIDDRLYVIDKVLKTNCTDVRWLYLYNKQNQIKQHIDKTLKEYNISDTLTAMCCDKELVYREMLNKNFQIPCVKVYNNLSEDCIFTFYSDYFDENECNRVLSNFSKINSDYTAKRIKQINNYISNKYYGYNVMLKSDNYDDIHILIQYYNNKIHELKINDINFDYIQNISITKIKEIKITYINMCSLYDIEEYLAYKDKSVSLLNDINGNRIGVYIKRYKEDEFSLYLKSDDYWNMHKWFICAVKGNEIRTSGKSYLYYTVEEFEKIYNKIISDKIRELRYN